MIRSIPVSAAVARFALVATLAALAACKDSTGPEDTNTGRQRRLLDVTAYADAGDSTGSGGGAGVGLPILTGTTIAPWSDGPTHRSTAPVARGRRSFR